MARTAVPILAGARDTVSLGGTLAAPLAGGIALDQANGHVITPKRIHRLVIVLYNSKAGNVQLTVKAGLNPPAENAGQGDLVVAGLITVTFSFITGLTGARFAQANGAIWVDTDAGATGTIWALEMPA